jgi:hypothetical protein
MLTHCGPFSCDSSLHSLQSPLMLILITTRQVQVLVRCLLRFLDKSVEQDHSALFVDVKENSRDSVLSQVRPHLVDPATHWPANGHPDRPAELHGLDILPDPFPVLGRQPSPLPPHRLSACLRAIEDRRNPLALSFKRLRRGPYACRGFRFLAH